MASSINHRKQLSEYLQLKQKQTHTRQPAVKATRGYVPARRGKTSIDILPDEIILKIFGYLNMGDLLSVAQVCHLWHQLSSDNLLWKKLLAKCLPSQSENLRYGDLKTANLKSDFMQRCIELRNKRILRLLKKKNPYTGIIQSKEVENAMKYAGISWQLVLTDTSGNEHVFQHQDVTYHLMSISMRWFSLTMIPAINVKKISMYSCNPLFYDNNTGKVIRNGPYQRSLLYTLDQRLNSFLEKTKPVGADQHLKVYALEGGIIIGIWKEGGEIAFISVSYALTSIVKRCIMGSASVMYEVKEDMSSSLSESSYGLYGYSCTVQLRTMKQEIWDKQFNNVECPKSHIACGFAKFFLVKEGERQLLQKELFFPWKTDAFKGKIKDVCCLEVVLTNNEGKVVWFCSSVVSVLKGGTRKYTFEMDFDYCREYSRSIEYSDNMGKIFMQIDQDEDSTYITYLTLQLSMDALAGVQKEDKDLSLPGSKI